MKYGDKARHIVNPEYSAERRQQDMKAKALLAKVADRRAKRQGKGGVPAAAYKSGGGSFPAFGASTAAPASSLSKQTASERPIKAPKQTAAADAALHPSWAAKKVQSDASIKTFAGSHVKFD